MLQKRYEDFLDTPFLWKDDMVFNLNQFQIKSSVSKINISIDNNLRLGKYVEHLVNFELNQNNSISILAENVQIQNNKITLGEIDCLLLKNQKPIHLEIVYKFYLYDDSIGNTEIEHFIGPNRKDALTEKLAKLKDKQLPILHSEFCKPYLEHLNLKVDNILQQIYFKAQLFVPYSTPNIQLRKLNNNCIIGTYITTKELNNFSDCKFFIPNKKDWLIIPHTHVNWMAFDDFKSVSADYLDRKFSPLCWVKLKNGELKKIFLVWW